MKIDDMDIAPEEPPAEERVIMKTVRRIIAKGNHAEIRQKKDGTLAVYEVRMSRVDASNTTTE